MTIKRRQIGVSILLSIVTCGIYSLVWLFSVVKEIASIKGPYESYTTELVLSILLPPVGLYMTEKKFTEGCAMRGIPHQSNGTIYVVMSLIGMAWIALAMMQSELNKIASPMILSDPPLVTNRNPLAVSCLSGTMKGRVYPIGNAGAVIGRDSTCAISLGVEASGVSRYHCSLSWHGDRLLLTDQGSTYGTFLSDGQRLNAQSPVPVSVGTRFYLGSTDNMFQIVISR